MLAKNLIESAGNASEPNYIESVFSTYLYTGDNTARSIVNGIDLATKGGMVWTAARAVADNKRIWDTSRGANKDISTNSTAAQSTRTNSVTSFNTDGFSLGTDGAGIVNASGSGAYTSWTFRKQPKFFDIVTYTGDGNNQRNISHSLGSVPGCIIIKRTNGVDNWWVFHRSLNNIGGSTYSLMLQSTAAQDTVGFLDTNTSTTFVVNNGQGNDSGYTYVAYIFAHDAGGFGLTGTDNVISCGSYTGNGSANGTEVNLGWEPQWLLVKEASPGTSNWMLVDNMRGVPTGGNTSQVQPNTSNAESAGQPQLDFTATGFKLTHATSYNTSGDIHIYIAIRRGPMKVPTDATKVFSPQTATGTGTSGNVFTTNFPVDLSIEQRQGSGGFANYAIDRLRGGGAYITPQTTAAEGSTTPVILFDSNTTMTNKNWGSVSGATYVDWMFRRAPSFFDEVCYTGTGSARTVTHNLGVTPELMIIKGRTNAFQWIVYPPNPSTADPVLYLNSDGSVFDGGGAYWNSTAPTSSVFTVNTQARVNASGITYVAYLFATCAGVSKVGSYTGTGTTKQVDCGFAAGARFVLIKRTDSTGDWYVWDTARGIVSGNDPYLLLNSTAAEVTTTDYIDTYSAGFELSSTAPAALNASGGTYIFLAIA